MGFISKLGRKIFGKKFVKSKKFKVLRAALGDASAAHKLLWKHYAPKEHRKIYRSLSSTFDLSSPSTASSTGTSSASSYQLQAGSYRGPDYRYRRLGDML